MGVWEKLGYTRFSTVSKVVVVVAFVQFLILLVLQSVILGIADFSILGSDRKIYAVLFICSSAYSVVFVWDALRKDNFIQVCAIVFLNLLYIVYSATQIFQFRDSEKLVNAAWSPADTLAVVSLVVIVIVTLLFIQLAYRLYLDLGWRIYKRIGSGPEIIAMYRTYHMFVMMLKLAPVFLIVFLIQHVAILLQPSDVEFALSIVAIFLIPVFGYLAFTAVKKENMALMVIFDGLVLASIAYFAYKIYRFATKSCPVCVANPNQSFVFLILFSAFSLATMLVLFIITCMVMRNFGKGLPAAISKSASSEKYRPGSAAAFGDAATVEAPAPDSTEKRQMGIIA